MKIKKYILVLPAVVTLLLTAVCCNNEIVEVPDLEQARIIPYTVSVGSSVDTRAVLNDSNYYEFESGDKLYVWGKDISGELTMDEGAGKYAATFSGNLTWTGSDPQPADNLDLNAVIVGPDNQIFGSSLAEFAANKYEPDYSAAVLDTDLKGAVRKLGYFKAKSRYDSKRFDFVGQQYCAFVFFNITLEDGTEEGSNIVVTISNNEKQACKGTIKTVKEYNEIRAKFVAGFPSLSPAWSTPSWYQLNEATVKLDNRDTLQFGGNSVLIGDMVYNVERNPRYTITASASNPLTGDPLPSQTVTDKKMGYTTELQSMMSTMGLSPVLSAMGINVTGCERTSPSDPSEKGSVDCVAIPESNPLDYKFTVVGTGDTVFTIKTDSSVPTLKSIPVTISVVKE